MIVSSDPDYINTKSVKKGFEQVDRVFQELSNWITHQFDTKVLNIYYDKIDTDKNRPRLNIIFEYDDVKAKFNDSNGNFDSNKQNIIANKFREILSTKFPTKKYETDRLLVIFSAFEPIARTDTINSIPDKEIEKFKRKLGMKDLWEINRQYGITTFFFYTDKQIEQYTNSGKTEFLKQKYFDLVKKHDEFDYFKKDTNFVEFDSKENFDNNYKSNWFYYSRK
jgi:hypothetical protein